MRSISVKRSSNGMLTNVIPFSDSTMYITVEGSKEVQIPEGAAVVILSKLSGTSVAYMRLGDNTIDAEPAEDILVDVAPDPYGRLLDGEEVLQLYCETECKLCLEFYK